MLGEPRKVKKNEGLLGAIICSFIIKTKYLAPMGSYYSFGDPFVALMIDILIGERRLSLHFMICRRAYLTKIFFDL